MALSLSAVQADGYYMPPEYDPRKHGSLDKYNNSHGSFGKRASKLHLGILIVRFEMPNNVWCLGCKEHIAQGVRFNAEKEKVGMYHSSPIWEFRMTCPQCKHPFVIRTDPKNSDFEYAEGCRKKHEEFSAASAETVELADEATRAALARDPFFRAESEQVDRQRALRKETRLTRLMRIQERRRDDGAINAKARAIAREDRKRHRGLVQEGARKGLSVPLLPATEADEAIVNAEMVKRLEGTASRNRTSARQRRNPPLGGSIFPGTTTSRAQSTALDPRAFRPNAHEGIEASGRKRPAQVRLRRVGEPVSKRRRLREVPVESQTKQCDNTMAELVSYASSDDE